MDVRYVGFSEQYRQEKDELLQAVQGVFERGDFVLGQEVDQFEKEFAQLAGTQFAVSMANGTDTLILGMRALGIGPGDEVITAPNSWISSASSVALIGARPVFVDVGPDQNIDPEKIPAAITSKTKAIMPVHLTGRCANMGAILEVSNKFGIPVIEDAAQSVLARVGSHVSGGSGLMGSFSLHPLKNLNAAGDAGVITTNNESLAHKLKLLRNHGLKNREEIEFWGYNSRLDTMQAAILRTRIPRLRGLIEKRRANAASYVSLLQDCVECPRENANEFHTYHVFVIQCDHRNDLMRHLQERGIETKIHYPIPIHLQKAAEKLGYEKGSFPVAERQADRILSLPIHQYLTEAQIEWVATSIRAFYRK